jgi:transposase-like protein
MSQPWLANLPPTPRQTWAGLSVAAVLIVALVVVIPFASKQLARIDAFIPAFEAIVFVTDLITSALLFSQFSISRSRALLALATGYLFTALIVIPNMLTFPGAFSESGLLGAGLQSTAWLYWFWHFGFPVALLAYGWFKNDKHYKSRGLSSPASAIWKSVALTFAMVCGLTCPRFSGPIFAGNFQFSGMSDSGRRTRKDMKRTKFTEAQIAFILRQGEEGTPVGEVCRKAGISEATYYNWRKKYGGLMPSEMKRLRQLEEENGKLKKIVADLSLDKEMLQDVIRRKL